MEKQERTLYEFCQLNRIECIIIPANDPKTDKTVQCWGFPLVRNATCQYVLFDCQGGKNEQD